MSKKVDFSRLSQKELAEAFRVTSRAVRDWHECPRNEDGSYDLGAVIEWRITCALGVELDLNQERARLAKEQADKTAIDNAVRRGELLDVDTVAQVWAKLFTSARSKLLGMPTQLAPLLAAMKNAIAIRDCITEALYRILEECSEYRPGSSGHSDGLGVETAAKVNGQSVGGSETKAQRGKQRGTGSVEH